MLEQLIAHRFSHFTDFYSTMTCDHVTDKLLATDRIIYDWPVALDNVNVKIVLWLYLALAPSKL